jgi:hypothetical protein
MKTSTTAIIFLFLTACNGRPTYNITVVEFQSNCEGAPVVRVEHDPEPEYKTVKIEPGYEAAAEQAQMKFSDDGSYVTVELGPDRVCKHSTGTGYGDCFFRGTKVPLPCTSRFKIISYRWPSKGPGSTSPLGKQGEDTPMPNDEYATPSEQVAGSKGHVHSSGG